MISDSGGPAFPVPGGVIQREGISKRDWFATFAPAPTEIQIDNQARNDQMQNPHGDSYKPKRRSREEIIADLRYAYADAMIAASKKAR